MKECRKERQKRLIEVYDHVRKFFGIHTKSGFAESVHYGRTSMSAAMNGKEEYLTDDLFENICGAYPGVFNLKYLLTGEGTLLTIREEVESERVENDTKCMSCGEPAPSAMPAWAENILSIVTQQIKDNEALNSELRETLLEVRTLRDDLRTLINSIK